MPTTTSSGACDTCCGGSSSASGSSGSGGCCREGCLPWEFLNVDISGSANCSELAGGSICAGGGYDTYLMEFCGPYFSQATMSLNWCGGVITMILYPDCELVDAGWITFVSCDPFLATFTANCVSGGSITGVITPA